MITIKDVFFWIRCFTRELTAKAAILQNSTAQFPPIFAGILGWLIPDNINVFKCCWCVQKWPADHQQLIINFTELISNRSKFWLTDKKTDIKLAVWNKPFRVGERLNLWDERVETPFLHFYRSRSYFPNYIQTQGVVPSPNSVEHPDWCQ